MMMDDGTLWSQDRKEPSLTFVTSYSELPHGVPNRTRVYMHIIILLLLILTGTEFVRFALL